MTTESADVLAAAREALTRAKVLCCDYVQSSTEKAMMRFPQHLSELLARHFRERMGAAVVKDFEPVAQEHIDRTTYRLHIAVMRPEDFRAVLDAIDQLETLQRANVTLALQVDDARERLAAVLKVSGP